jgi:hypothetical protein
MGETRVTSTPVWQMVDFLGWDFPSEVNHNLVVKLNTGCVQNVVTTWRCRLGLALLGTDAEDSFFPGTGHTYPHLDEIHDQDPLAPVGHKVQLKKSLGSTYYTRQFPCKSKLVLTLDDSTGFRLLGYGTSNTTQSCAQQDIIYAIIHDIMSHERHVPYCPFPESCLPGLRDSIMPWAFCCGAHTLT